MGFEISSVNALEILDSRGRPTLNVTVALADGTRRRGGCPVGCVHRHS
jgi:enolase